jgi:YARHG domain
VIAICKLGDRIRPLLRLPHPKLKGNTMSETAGAFRKHCPQCGGIVDADAKFCKHCAFNLINSSPKSEVTAVTPKSEKKTNVKPILLITGIAIIVLLILGLFVAYRYKNNHAQTEVVTTSPTPTPAPIMSERAKQIEEKILRGEALNDSDIEGLSVYELRVLRNVHFARYGRKYEQEGQLGGYFYTRSWYKPSDSYNDNMITATDKANINLILAAEKSANSTEVVSVNNNTIAATNSQPVSTPTPPSRNELTRETVLSLARESLTKKVVASMNTSSNVLGNLTEIYTKMIKAKVITCPVYSQSCLCWDKCRPGVNGRGLYLQSVESSVAGSLGIAIGYKVPTEVTGISRIDQSSAYADVVLGFQRSEGYTLFENYRQAFWNHDYTQGERHRILLRLYDDGWRLERVIM